MRRDGGKRPPPAALSALLVGVLLAVFSFAGCGDGGAATPEGSLRVVATTTVLADLVEQVGGDRVETHALVPKGGEVHTFDPRPSDARRLTEADLLVMNGLGLDEWLADLATDIGASAATLVLGEDLAGVEYIEGGHEDAAETTDAHADEGANPHLWLDVALASRYVERIAEALAGIDPDGAETYRSRATSYGATLEELDAWIRATLATIPEEQRRVVSLHDAFPYFARAYGLEIVGTVIDAPGQDPSAGEIADLVRAIDQAGVRAILSEVQFSPRLVETIAAETGATVVADLYSDSLGDPPVDTYEALMRWDTDRIVDALG